MQSFRISFLTDTAPLKDSALLMQSDQLNISVLMLPRSQLDAVISNDLITDLPQRGVYVLYGMQHVYVGKTNQGLERIKQHDRSKDFWQVALLFLSAAFDEEIIAGLEAETIAYMQKHSKFVLENKQQPQHQYAHKQTELNVREWLQQLQNVLGFLGSNPLAVAQANIAAMLAKEQLQAGNQGTESAAIKEVSPLSESHVQAEVSASAVIPAPLRDVMFLQIGKITARMSFRGVKQWVVLAGSQLRGAERKEEQALVKKTIAEAEENHTITLQADGTFVTNVDFTFSSPSAAMAFVYGFGVSALDKWHNEAGVTLRDLLAQSGLKEY